MNGHLFVLMLGSERHIRHPTVTRFVETGKSRGHTVELLSKGQFLDPNFSWSRGKPDVICMKSHYDDWRVWEKVESAGSRVINTRLSTTLVSDRLSLAVLLLRQGLDVPRFAKEPSDLDGMSYPLVRKTRLAWGHDLAVLERPPARPDTERYFYQELVENDGVDYKLYRAGTESFLVERPSSLGGPRVEKTQEGRVESSPSTELSRLSAKVGTATGLEIFGVDFVKGGGTNYVVDVNPFPGFVGVAGAAVAWWEVLEGSPRVPDHFNPS
ncbi:MAG: ATP-grasp domain-containing protein [Promethearchaeota archaeon]